MGMTYQPTHYGIEVERIEAAMRRARRERREAMRALLERAVGLLSTQRATRPDTPPILRPAHGGC